MRKYLMLLLGLILLLCAGTCNLYPLYLKLLVEKYNFTINQINFFETCINIGLWFAFPTGLLYDKYGSRISLIIALIFLPGSYMVLHFVLNSDKLQNFPFFYFALLAILLGQGSSICYTTAMTINVNNFRFKNSSLIVSMLAVNISLGPSIFAFYKENISYLKNENFYFILSIFIAIVIFFCLIIFKRYDLPQNYDTHLLKSLDKYRSNNIVKNIYRLNTILCISFIISIVLNNFGIKISKNFNLFLIPVIVCAQFISLYFLVKRYQNNDFEKEYLSKYENKRKNLIIDEKSNNSEIKQKENKQDLELINVPKIENKDIKKNNQQKNLFSIQQESGEKISNRLIEYENDEYNKQSIDIYISESINKENNEYSKNKSDNQILNKFDKDDYLRNYNKKYISLMFLSLLFGMGSVISNYNNMNYIVDTLYFMDFHISNFENKTSTNLRFLNNSSVDVIERTNYENSSEKIVYDSSNLYVTHQIHDWNNMFNVSDDKNENIMNFTSLNNTNINNSYTTKDETNFIQDNLNKEKLEIIVIETNKLQKLIKNKVFFYVIVYFTSNAITRLFSNSLLEYLIKKDGMFYHLLLTNILGLISQSLGILMKKELFIIIIALCGSCHGFYMTFIPIYVKKYYLPKNFGFMLGILTSGGALGSLINSNYLFVYSYQKFGVFLDPKSSLQVCREYKCFFYSYYLNAIFFLLNILISLYFIIKKNKIN